MPTQLIITEKPKVAEKMAYALSEKGAPSRKNLHGVSYFELSRGKKDIIVSPAVGHVYSLKPRGKGTGYPVFDIEWVPASEVGEGAEYTKKYLSTITSLCRHADEVVNACDYDIEGSLIGGNIIRFGCKGKDGKRMLFSTLTKEDLVAAYESLSALDTPQINAGEARHMLDWYWGINASRALMQAIRSAGAFRIMSIGRVQGPALSILAHREKEISAFVSTPYWEISAQIKGAEFKHTKDRFLDEKEANTAYADAKSASGAVVRKVAKTKYKQSPPTPFDLTTLQIEAYSVFGIEPSRTLVIAQSLYEAALISYPRTSSQKLPAKLGLKKIISELSKNPAYAKLAGELLAANRIVPREGDKEDAAHPSVHPTGMIATGLRAEEQKLYDLIAKRFLSCFAPEALLERVRVDADVSRQPFFANGSSTVDEGWFAFYRPYVKFEEQVLPGFAEGERCNVERVDLEKKMTQPPKRYTSASLIKKLESENLGTKATRAEIIETLRKRGYVSGKSFEVSALGMAVFETLHKNVSEILSEQLTRQFEEEMDGIQSGAFSEEKVLEEGRGALLKILEHFKKNELALGKELSGALKETRREQSVLGPCRLCSQEGREGGQLVIRKSRFGFFVGCAKYPECKAVFPLPKNALIEPLGTVCEKCGTPQVKVIRKERRPFSMCVDPNCPTKADWGKKWEEKSTSAEKQGEAATPTTNVPAAKPQTDVPRKAAEGAKPQADAPKGAFAAAREKKLPSIDEVVKKVSRPKKPKVGLK